MNLLEAIKSGKPFRRSHFDGEWYLGVTPMLDFQSANNKFSRRTISREDLLAENYELKEMKMNLLEAIKSGKPFRRRTYALKGHIAWFKGIYDSDWPQDRKLCFYIKEPKDPDYPVKMADFLAEDYEVKDECCE